MLSSNLWWTTGSGLSFFFSIQQQVLLLALSQTVSTVSCNGPNELLVCRRRRNPPPREETPGTFKRVRKKYGKVWEEIEIRQREPRPKPQATCRTLPFKSDNVTYFTSHYYEGVNGVEKNDPGSEAAFKMVFSWIFVCVCVLVGPSLCGGWGIGNCVLINPESSIYMVPFISFAHKFRSL